MEDRDVIIGDVNMSFLCWIKHAHKNQQDIDGLYHMIKKLDLVDICRTNVEFMTFSIAHRILTKMDHMICQNQISANFKGLKSSYRICCLTKGELN